MRAGLHVAEEQLEGDLRRERRSEVKRRQEARSKVETVRHVVDAMHARQDRRLGSLVKTLWHSDRCTGINGDLLDQSLRGSGAAWLRSPSGQCSARKECAGPNQDRRAGLSVDSKAPQLWFVKGFFSSGPEVPKVPTLNPGFANNRLKKKKQYRDPDPPTNNPKVQKPILPKIKNQAAALGYNLLPPAPVPA